MINGTPLENRSMPSAEAAEQVVLGSLMFIKEGVSEVFSLLDVHDFYNISHQKIYKAMLSLYLEKKPLGPLLLMDILEREGELETVGGDIYIRALHENIPYGSNLSAYANLIKEKATLRHLLEVGGHIFEGVYSPNGRTTQDLVEELQSKFYTLSQFAAGKGRLKRCALADLAAEVITSIEDRVREGGLVGLSSGFVGIDNLTNGFKPGELIIVAARPSMGKTTLALNIMENVMKKNKKILFFSIEMDGKSIGDRVCSSLSHVPLQKIIRGNLNDFEWHSLCDVIRDIAGATFEVIDEGVLSPFDVESKVYEFSHHHDGIDLVVIDYLQLMHVKGLKSAGRVEEISAITRSLKGIAKKFKVPLIALSQLNRNLEGRPEKRPMMADLRDSGSIEQDADIILFIFREEVYNKDTTQQGVAEIILSKNRNGALGTIKANFNPIICKFTDLEPTLVQDIDNREKEFKKEKYIGFKESFF